MPIPTIPRVVMLGLDAAELGLVRANLATLPALRRVLAEGAVARLDSTAGLLPGSVWPTFFTGALPGVHGIYHHLQWDPGGMRIRRVAADWLDVAPFWRGLARRGLAVATVDVPMTFPPRPTAGVEVINWGSHDQLGPFAVEPTTLRGEIVRRFGRSHPMGAEIPVEKTPAQLDRIRRRLVVGARRKGELVRWLLGLRAWDFFLGVFGETHRGGHILWPEGSHETEAALLDVYRAVDGALAAVLDAVPRDATVIVFALHGMGPNTSQEHFVPRVVDRVNARFAGGDGSGATVAPAGQRSIVRLLRERVPARLQNAIAQAVPVWVRDEVMNRQVAGGHVWARTPGLALLADLNGYLRWNVRERERDGLLAPGSADLRRYETAVREGFAGLRVAGTGAPVVAEVVTSGAELTGPRAHCLPDAIVTWSGVPPAAHLHSETLGDFSAELATGRGGNHRPQGFCAVLGSPEARAHAASLRHIVDLAPLVTERLLGVRR